MNTGRIATVALAGLAVAGVVGTIAIWQVGHAGAVQWSGREPGEAALWAFAVLQLSYSLALPACATLAAASTFALVVLGARAISVRWVERDAAGTRAHAHVPAAGVTASASERRADDERARLDVEVRSDD